MTRYVAKVKRRRSCYRCAEPIHVGELVEKKRLRSKSRHYHADCYDRMHY
jgi:hypothetical protein